MDDEATPTMRESLMYKMSYYRFNEIFGGGPAMDRVRGSHGPSTSPQLDTLDEVFTSQNWLVRIYQVKKEDALARDLPRARAFEQGKRQKQAEFDTKGSVVR